MKGGPRSPQLEKAHTQQQRPNAAKKENMLMLKIANHHLSLQRVLIFLQ